MKTIGLILIAASLYAATPAPPAKPVAPKQIVLSDKDKLELREMQLAVVQASAQAQAAAQLAQSKQAALQQKVAELQTKHHCTISEQPTKDGINEIVCTEAK